MTKNSFNRTCLSTITIAALLLAAPMAYAQSGSRLCGWTADLPPGAVLGTSTLPAGGKMGILYEARDDDASYHKQCDDVISKVKSSIDGDADLKGFPWTKVKRATCESVGSAFVSTANPNVDMCQYMGAKKAYTVIKPYNSPSKTAASTTYTQHK